MNFDPSYLLVAVPVAAGIAAAALYARSRRGAKGDATARVVATLEGFAAAPLERRGFLCYTTAADPHTLIIARQPGDAPTPDIYRAASAGAYPVAPVVMTNAENLTGLIMNNPDIRGFRFLHCDGMLTARTVRRGDVLTPHIEAIISDAADREANKTRVRSQSERVFNGT